MKVGRREAAMVAYGLWKNCGKDGCVAYFAFVPLFGFTDAIRRRMRVGVKDNLV